MHSDGGKDYVPEKYSDYRNRNFQKHKEKLTNQLRQIKECSLKEEDKKRLMIILENILTVNIKHP